MSPQYSVQISDWKTGDEVAADDFTFDNATGADMIAFEDIQVGDLPENFTQGAQ